MSDDDGDEHDFDMSGWDLPADLPPKDDDGRTPGEVIRRLLDEKEPLEQERRFNFTSPEFDDSAWPEPKDGPLWGGLHGVVPRPRDDVPEPFEVQDWQGRAYLVSSGGICSPVSPFYDFVWREPWELPDRPWMPTRCQVDAWLFPRLTGAQRRLARVRREVKTRVGVLVHGLPPDREYLDDDW